LSRQLRNGKLLLHALNCPPCHRQFFGLMCYLRVDGGGSRPQSPLSASCCVREVSAAIAIAPTYSREGWPLPPHCACGCAGHSAHAPVFSAYRRHNSYTHCSARCCDLPLA
jgi:hypothetical protein